MGRGKWDFRLPVSCPTLCNPVDCSSPGSSVHEILQARILEWVAISFSRGSSQPVHQTQVSRIAGRRFNLWATGEAPYYAEGGQKFYVQFSSLVQSCLTLCNTINHSTSGLPVHHQLPESTQTHVHRVGDAIKPSHSLSSPSPPALNLSQHQGLFQSVSSSHQVAKVSELQLQHQSFQWIFRVDFL